MRDRPGAAPAIEPAPRAATNTEQPSLSPRTCALFLTAVVGLGALYRYYDIGAQIPQGDEWHSLFRAADTSLAECWTRYFPRATSIPVNGFQRWLLETVGWTEVSIRLLSIVAGLSSLLLVPLGALWATGSPCFAITIAIAFAASPFWIFYAQNSRPYAPFFLLLLVCLHCFWRGLSTNRSSHWLGFGVSGALAVYFHLYALPALAPLGLVAGFHLVRERGRSPGAAKARVVGAALGFGTLAALQLLLYAPALQHGISERLPVSDGIGVPGPTFFVHAAELLTGAAFGWVAIALIAISGFGLVVFYRSQPLALLIVAASCLGSTVFTALVQPSLADVALVFLRYNVGFFLLYFLGLAAAVERATQWLVVRYERLTSPPRWLRREHLIGGTLGFFALALVGVSPVPTLLAIQPNNFRQHAAYTEYYSGWDPNRVRQNDFFPSPDRRTVNEIPRFYATLTGRSERCRLIEFPYTMREDESPYYFYQHHHGCEVLVGYTRHDPLGRALKPRDNAAGLRFRQLVDLERAPQIRAADADYLLVHHDLHGEVRDRDQLRPSRRTRQLLRRLSRELGEPAYTDRHLTAFDLRAR